MSGRHTFHGILFDKDGTLFDFQASWSKWMLQILNTFTQGDWDFARHIGVLLGFDVNSRKFLPGSPFVSGTPDVAVQVFMNQFPEKTPTEIVQILTDSSNQPEQVPAVPLPALLNTLRNRSLAIGLVTNDLEDTAILHLQATKCRHYFDYIAGSDSGYGAKPDPAMLLAFCSKFSIKAQNCLMVGDSPTDLQAGRRAGMTTIAVLTGIDDRDTLSPLADAVLDDIGQLPDWLNGQDPNRKNSLARH